jgi:hypothetical protein
MLGKSPPTWGPYRSSKAPSALPFFLLVFALAVPFWIIGMVVDAQPLPGLPIAAAMFVCPALAALILTYRDHGRIGVTALFRRSFDGRRIPKLWYLPIMMLMPGVAVATFALERWTGTAVPEPHIALLPSAGLFGMAVIHAMFNLCWQLFPDQGSYFDPRLNGLIMAALALAAIVVTRGTLRPAHRPASGEY